MLKKSLALFLVFVLVVSAFVGCAQKQEPSKTPEEQPNETTEEPAKEELKQEDEQILTYNLLADPDSIDPHKATSVGASIIMQNIFEGLVRTNENMEQDPGAAESWETNEDKTVWTFHLRKDAKWSDGKDLTAEDFVYGWKRAVDPATACEYAYMLDPVKNATKIYSGELDVDELGVKAIDEKTLEVTLEQPTAYILELFAFPTYFPVRKDVVEKNPEAWEFDPATAITNGPFKLGEYIQNDVLKIVPNENYWDKDRVKLDEVRFVFITEQSTGLAAFEAGDIDGTDEVPSQEIPRLQSESDEFIIAPYLGTYFYCFNVTKEPFDNLKVRQAFAKAIDRNAIVTTVTLGGQKPATGFVPPGIMTGGEDFRKAGGDYGVDPMAAQVEEAQKLLAEAGYPNGEGFPKVTLKYNTSENHKRIAEAIQEMWKKNLNVDVELENMEWRVFIPARQNGEFQIARHGWIGDYNHPMTFLDMFLSESGNNDPQWKNEEFDKLIYAAKKESDPEKAAELMHKAEDLMMKDQIVMPIYYYTHPYMMKNYVKGYFRTPLGHIFFDRAYIEGKNQ
ncbi:peptide ABC transporter substrate-binding protein [Paramaledivibacter caminithermalis]|uniref:Oligopeptide transport system substrate-binding protein n=1 Tax=Paramaledivibacter caminithermalis (strain DSM 15212 / CIP 107654 / DViRD3) TaxID=1121301 RepID=A0A1M6NU03_PARC5|nr:peptide ABC transporter substrate-binding protein [Paramaledivibacter caminithermalis]SHJ99217.1 oligopeptide transport system substrate-binding protein [Paramaledivibacter caminithermalis DSM 15212]